jgi:hypothetical protein
MAKPVVYPDATPVDEPTSPEAKAPKAKATAKAKPVVYPDATPVDEPTKKYAKGGKIDGIAQRGKTRGKIV